MITLTPASDDQTIELHACLTRCYRKPAVTPPQERVANKVYRWTDISKLPRSRSRAQYHPCPRHHQQWLRDRKLHQPTDWNRKLRYSSIV